MWLFLRATFSSDSLLFYIVPNDFTFYILNSILLFTNRYFWMKLYLFILVLFFRFFANEEQVEEIEFWEWRKKTKIRFYSCKYETSVLVGRDALRERQTKEKKWIIL